MINSPLSQLKCEPCSGNTPKLSLDEIHKRLSEVNEWKLNDNKEMIFKNPMTPSKQGFSAAALFGRPELTQGQRIKFGIKINNVFCIYGLL